MGPRSNAALPSSLFVSKPDRQGTNLEPMKPNPTARMNRSTMKTNRKIGMLLACLTGVCLFISQARAAVSVVAAKSTRYNGVGAWVANADPPLTWDDATFQIPAGGPPGKLVVMIAGE